MSSQPVEVRPLPPEEDEARDVFVRTHPSGSFFHLAGWGNVIQRVFWHQRRDLGAWREDELVGVLPMMRTPGLVGPGSLVSMPYGVYGGPIATDPEAEAALLAAAKSEAERERVGHLELRYKDEPGNDMASSDLYWTFVRELPETEEEVLSRMPKKARAEARKARDRHGLELATGIWYLDDLQRLFVRNKHSLGSPGLPLQLFQELRHEFGDDVQVHLVRRGGEPMAAVMTFRFGETLMAYYSGTAEGADRACSASNFMYMALQQWGVREGLRVFDFGRSRKDAGAFSFKAHQGFEAAPLAYRYHLVTSRALPSFTPSNPKTALVRNIWKRLPHWMVQALSDRLARYLP